MRYVLTSIIIMLVSSLSYSATIHVPSDQPTIQAGIDAAVDGDTVLVDSGIYLENIRFYGKQLTLLSVHGVNQTFIQPNNYSQPVVTFNDGEDTTTVIDGFSIGNTNGYWGILCQNSSPIIRNCNISNCIRSEGNGAGIWCANSGAKIRYNRIHHNSGHATGAGIGVQGTNIIPLEISFNEIYSNDIAHGCGIGCISPSSNIYIYRNLIRDNIGWSTYGAAIYYNGTDGSIINNTIVDNTKGIFVVDGDGINIINNIIVGSEEEGMLAGSAYYDYNDTWNNGSANNAGVNGISADPLFANPTENDYTLAANSTCINAGDPDIQYNDPDGTRNDMGAFPYDSHTPITLIVPDEYVSIQEAVDSALAGDTIYIRDGTYSEHVMIGSKDIFIVSENGADFTSVISDTSRCFTIDNSIITCEGIRITGRVSMSGSEPAEGGGVYITNSNVTIVSSQIVDSYCSSLEDEAKGGAIFATNCTMLIKSSGLSSNELAGVYTAGGAIYIEGKLSMDSCTVGNNTAWAMYPDPPYALGGANGAGIYCLGDSTIIANTQITGNDYRGVGNGGGACIIGDDSFLHNCNISNNVVRGSGRYGYDSHGGGLSLTGNNGVISDCRINNNSTVAGGTMPGLQSCFGGGLYVSGNNLVEYCIVMNNSAHATTQMGTRSVLAGGGGIYATGNNMLVNNTIVENISFASLAGWDWATATAIGGGCYSDGDIANNIIYANNVTADISQCDYPDSCTIELYGSGVYIESSLAECNLYFTNIGAEDWYGDIGVNNMNLDPLFCDMPSQDYSLMDVSPGVPENNDCNEWIGAFEIGCSGKPSVPQYGIVDEDANHVINNIPEIWWGYSCPLGNPEDSFNIAVGTDNDWQYAEMWNPAPFEGPDTSVTYGGAALLDGETYYLRLRVHNGLAWSDWYETSFRMNSVPSVPVPLSPIGGETVESITPMLYVQNSADPEGDPLTYDYIVYPDSDFVWAYIEGVAEQTDSTGWTVNNPLGENAVFLWAARADDGYETSEWSLLDTFWVNASEEYPSAFELYMPPDTSWAQVYEFPVLFWWGESYDADPYDSVYYRLLIAIDSNFTFVATYDSLFESCCPLTGFTTEVDLDYSTHYWWKVYAIDTKGNMTQSSNVADFMTWILGDVNADFSVSVGDAVFLINYIFKGGYAPIPLKIGDVNGNCLVDVADAVYLIRYIFQEGPAPIVGCAEE